MLMPRLAAFPIDLLWKLTACLLACSSSSIVTATFATHDDLPQDDTIVNNRILKEVTFPGTWKDIISGETALTYSLLLHMRHACSIAAWCTFSGGVCVAFCSMGVDG